MKKLFYAILALATLTLASCEKDPIGGTATEKLSGQWYVTTQGIDADGSVVLDDEDLFGIGGFLLLTYSTAGNTDSLWIDDIYSATKEIWDKYGFKVRVGCNTADGSFGIANGYDIKDSVDVEITNGKILLGAAKTPSGQPADSIVFDILFSNDPFAGTYYDRLRVTGYRYTGLANDD